MAAGQGFKTFATGDVLSAADVNGYLMQGVLVFADATERNAEITSPQEGQFAYLKDTNVTTYYTGSAWANLDTTGMTNPMTTTGDTIYSSSGSTPARLGIGSTGQVLTVAGGVPSWATPASGTTFVGASVYNSTTQSIANNTYTILTFNSEAFDSDAFHSTSTNTSRLTIPAGKSGKYQVTAALGWENVGTYNYGSVLFKNGSAYQYINFTAGTTAGSLNSWSFVIDLVATDYLEWQVYQGSGSANNAKGNNAPSERTTFSINYLGA